mgnify:CR=1 FL=1
MVDTFKYRQVGSSSMLFSMGIGIFIIASLVYSGTSVAALAGSPVAEKTRETLSYVYNGTFYGCGLAFLHWLYNLAENCRALGVRGMRYTPVKTLLWWFIPILNLVVPYRVMQEIWRASKPEIPVPDDWDTREGSKLIVVWWIVYVVGGILGVFAVYQQGQTEGPGYFAIDLLVGVGDIASAVLVMMVVRAVTRRQNEFAGLSGFDSGEQTQRRESI